MNVNRIPLMETSNNSQASSPLPTAESRRRSGRVVKVPPRFSPDAPPSSKRKRNVEHDDEDAENESPGIDGEDSDDDAAESADDVEELRSKKKASKATKSKKPAAKRVKTNGVTPVNGSVAAKQLPSRPKKTVRLAVPHREGDGLYADIFGSGDSSDDVASRWYHQYTEDSTAAMKDLVNCILLTAGCDQQVTEDDINDPDNVPNRLTELQDIYQEQEIVDYPLISRTKGTKDFRDLLIGFFKSLVEVMHETELLYKDSALFDNIHHWAASMSSSALRPFRHTATTIVLSLQAALINTAKKLDERVAKFSQQVDSEKGRRGKSKDRLAIVQRSLDEANQNRETCGLYMKDIFDTVFVHRYRDIDSRIRTACVEALGNWIMMLPTVYMEPEYLRYLGWMLSDVAPPVRNEVLKQLARILKRDAEKLGHFIDRFRARLIEIATKDQDVGVRVTAISVVEVLHASEMLDPEEIDAIGKLLFDSEVRVRKAVVGFFEELVKMAISAKVDEIGGDEALDEVFGGEDDEESDFEAPRRDWIDIKCLAEMLAIYDAQLDDEPAVPPRVLDASAEALNVIDPETVISHASQVLYDRMELVRDWEHLSGYLLYDHSTSEHSKPKSKTASTDSAVRKAYAPTNDEEYILLQVMTAAVKTGLTQSTEAERNRKKSTRAEAAEAQEEHSLHLATVLPKLLKKFGADAKTATVVLRMVHFLDVSVFQQLRQDSSTYTRLLDEISVQFDRHIDKSVLSEANLALLHARRHEELLEVTDSKLSLLWENAITSLRNFDKTDDLSKRGNLGDGALRELATTLLKMSKLASLADCVDVLEAEGQSDDSRLPAIELLAKTVRRGYLEQSDDGFDFRLEDEANSYTISVCHFYFMWKVRALLALMEGGREIPNEEVTRISKLHETYTHNLIGTLSSRAFNDDARLWATGKLCDLYFLCAQLRAHIEQARGRYEALTPLTEQIPSDLIPEVVSILDGAERAYAKLAKKTLNEPAEDEDPIDDDDELMDEDDEDEELATRDKRAAQLKAEKELCELAGQLVMAILAKVIDQGGRHDGKLRKRLLRNQAKLGANYKEVVSYLDESKLNKTTAKKGKGKSKAVAAAAAAAEKISDEIIVDGDSDSDPSEDAEPEEGTEADLRKRELLDDPIEDDEDEGEQAQNGADEDEDVLGD